MRLQTAEYRRMRNAHIVCVLYIRLNCHVSTNPSHTKNAITPHIQIVVMAFSECIGDLLITQPIARM